MHPAWLGSIRQIWTEGLFKYPWNPEVALAARAQLTDYLRPIVHAYRIKPADNLISRIANAEVGGNA